MRSWMSLTFVAFLATFPLSGAGLAKVNSSCAALERPCECVRHVRDCIPRCLFHPPLECPPL
jgi:hypothetical protein